MTITWNQALINLLYNKIEDPKNIASTIKVIYNYILSKSSQRIVSPINAKSTNYYEKDLINLENLPKEILEIILSYIPTLDSNHNLTEMRLISQKINRTIINSNNERIQKVFENILKNKLYENAYRLNFKTKKENLNLMKEIEEIISFCKEYHCCHRSLSKAFLRLLKFLRYIEFHFIKTDNISKEILSTDHLNYSLWDHKEKEKIFIHACKGGRLKIINDFIDQDFIDPSTQSNKAIQSASSEGKAEIVELLLKDKRVDPSANNNFAIRWASYHGRIKVVELLLKDKRVDPSVNNNFAIRFASREGHIKVVELLLRDERVDPSAENNEAIRSASLFGYTKIVELLLKHKKSILL